MAVVIFCFGCAFIFYELTGIIGREMLADKHITGSGEGYQNVVFGKDSKDSLIVNIQYNVFAPIIYMLLIAAALQYFEMNQLAQNAVYIVPCYYLVRGFMITVVSGKRQLYNPGYEFKVAMMGTILAFAVQYALVLPGKGILPTVEEFRTQLWLVFLALAYQFVIRTFGRSAKNRQNKVCTQQMKKKYILDKYDAFREKYDSIVNEIAPGNYLQRVIYSIMIYENFNRTKTQRWGENIIFLLGKRPMTLGIMQVKTLKFIRDAQSVEMGCQKVKQSFEEYVERASRENDQYYRFEGGEPEICLEKICQDYNGAEDYVDAIKYIFYTLHEFEYAYDETYEIEKRMPKTQEITECSENYAEVYTFEELAEKLGRCSHIKLLEDCSITPLETENVHAVCDPIYRGNMLIVENVEDLTVEGQHKIITLYGGDGLCFRNCKNLTLHGISFKQQDCVPEEVEAEPILRFDNCAGINLEQIEIEARDRKGIFIHQCRKVCIEGGKLQGCCSVACKAEESDIAIASSVFTQNHCAEGVIQVSDGLLNIENSILEDNPVQDNLIYNINSNVKCNNVFVKGGGFKQISNQVIGQGVHVVKDCN